MKRARIYRCVHPGCRNPWHATLFEDDGIWVKRTALKPAPTWDGALETALAAIGLTTPTTTNPEPTEAP